MESNFHQRRSQKILKKFKPILIITSLVIFTGLAVSIFAPATSDPKFSFPLLKKEKQINVLLLGNAGGAHDGAYLTDTVIVASYDPEKKQAYFISLPRDLWIEDKKAKLNAVYEYAPDKQNALKHTEEVVGNILGIPIDYGVRLDFRGFVKAVDTVGGLDINVEKSFDDYLYPITGKENDLCGFKEEEKEFNEEEAKKLNIPPGKRKVLIAPDGKIATDSAEPEKGFEYFKCRYEHISFKKGETHMSGEIALKFVRSRMGTNGEGSDFARSRRQQKVIEAFRAKVLSLDTLVNPQRMGELINAFGQSFETDIPVSEMVKIYNLSKKSERNFSYVLSNVGKDALLINPPIGEYGAWVLVPKDKTYKDIHSWAQKIIEGEVVDEASSSARPSPR